MIIRHDYLSWIPILLITAMCGELAVAKNETVEGTLKFYEDWWYKAAAFPSGDAREILQKELERGSKDPRVAFWLSRDILRRNLGKPDKVQRDEARRLTRLAAEGGLDIAIVYVTYEEMHNEKANPEDRNLAAKRLAEMLQRREPEAALALGEIYRVGKIVPKDLEKSAQLFRAAIKLGHVRAYHGLAKTLRDVGEFSDAVSALEKGVELGSTEAQINLGILFKDTKRGIELLRRAAETGSPLAKLELAKVLGTPEMSSDDHIEALRLLEQAAPYNDEAKLHLARAYLFGGGKGEINLVAAEKLLRELAAAGDAEANYLLGVAHLEGIWLPRDEAEAMRFLNASASRGHTAAQGLVRLHEFQKKKSK